MSLIEKIRNGDVVVGVIGLGYVGLPLAKVFVGAGVRCVGFDVDPKKIESIGRGENYLRHFGGSFVSEMNQTGLFEATADFDRLGEPDAILVCVPTPLGAHLEADLSYVEETTEQIARRLRSGQLVVLESTTYPGTTREVMLPRLAASGLGLGGEGDLEGFLLAYSPEREDPGRKDHTTQTIPKLVGGVDDASGDAAEALYALALESVIRVRSAEVAEAAKILENTFRAVNIALVNELKVLLTEMGIDVWEVVEAASTKPFGFMPFYPGPGLGGHCIPIDPFYLTWKAREVGLSTRFIELAGEVNHAMPGWVIGRVVWALNERGKSVKGSKILVLGLAYKPDVDDVRESPSLELIERLRELGAEVEYNDPHVPATHKMRRYDLKMESVELSADRLSGYDAVLVSTNHSAYDWQLIADNARLVIDTRNALKGVVGPRGHIVGA